VGRDEIRSVTISVIDIGTNTILMVTVRIGDDGALDVLGDEHAIARLGRGVDATRAIMPETFDRVEGFLHRYRSIAESFGTDRIIAFGTSALRDARNQSEFIAAMRQRTGIEIEVLSGEEEATWTYRGALLGLTIDAAKIAVLDIGGGSTELALGDGAAVDRAISLDIGAVRISERFLPSLPPTPAQLDAAGRWAAEQSARFFELPKGTRLVGVAGTVTTLGAIVSDLERFDAAELNGTSISLEEIDAIIERIAPLTREQVAAIPQIAEGRADIILGGATILAATMRRLDAASIIVSTRGVRYGIALRENEKLKMKN
jgi:exopolyphosphatase / guanosine-5'-triphosphate,3'-diphosphate pyrophosphatase